MNLPLGQDLFDRDFSMTVGTIQIPMRFDDPLTQETSPSLRVTFNIEKDTAPGPNKAKIEVFNLNAAHRKSVQEGWPIVVEGGYVGNRQRLFGGWIESSDNTFGKRMVEPGKQRVGGPRTIISGVDRITKIEADDGVKAFRSSRIALSLGPGTTIFSLLQQVAARLGLGLGNSAAKFNVPLRGRRAFKKSTVVTGQVSRVLNKYVATAGYQWSIQDGELQVLAADDTTIESVPELSRTSGLIGTPELGEKGKLKARSLLNGEIHPGRLVSIAAEEVQGFFKVLKSVYIGDSWGSDWYTDFEAKEVRPI